MKNFKEKLISVMYAAQCGQMMSCIHHTNKLFFKIYHYNISLNRINFDVSTKNNEFFIKIIDKRNRTLLICEVST